ncbi:hypothetical protein B566_EDAN018498 [Ephemera danica]|nr:hypothetical protein B566_EDAN018498 [Ephemera danica]
MRSKLVAGNWKMHGELIQNRDLLNAIVSKTKHLRRVDCAVCVPYPYLSQVQLALIGTHISWGAQNLSQHEKGAYTGEISGVMLTDFGCRYVIIGHSERRVLYGEDSNLVASKFKAAQAAGLTPVLCVGETLEHRETGITEQVITEQLDAVIRLNGLKEESLTLAQRNTLIEALEYKSKLTFTAIKTLLKTGGAATFNFEDPKRQELKGNTTSAILSKDMHFGNAWFNFDEPKQDAIVLQLVKEENEAKLVQWLRDETGVDEHRAVEIANVGLPEGDRKELGQVPLDDIAAVIANAHGLSYTNNLLVALAERCAPFVLCAANHNAVGMVIAIEGNYQQAKRFDAQLAASQSLKKKTLG